MKPESPTEPFAIPPALLAEINAVAEEEHRSAVAVLQDAVTRYVRGDRLLQAEKTQPVKPTPAEAVAHILETRKGRHLPEGMTIREMMTHGRD